MVAPIREAFNKNFSQQSYEALQDWVARQYDYRAPFRIAETPVFVPNLLKKKLFDACEMISDVICRSRLQGAV